MEIFLKDLYIDADRQRRNYGNIDRLADGMKRLGQIQPILVEEGNFPNDKKYKLVAGGRRVRAAILNNWTVVEAAFAKDVDPVKIEEMELEENVNRKDLDWQEEIDALARIDSLKRKIHGSSASSGSTPGKGWSLEDTADLVNRSISSVNQDIMLANALKNNPALLKRIGNAPKTAARKIVIQEEQARTLKLLFEQKGKPVGIDLRMGKAEELIDQLPDESVHLWLTDPPYAVDEIISVSNSATYNTTKSNVSDKDTMMGCYTSLLPKVFKKLVPGAHIYVMFGMSWYTDLLRMLREAGFIVDDVPLIWNKCRPTVMAKDMHYMSSYAPLFFGYKPPVTRILRKPIANVLSIPMVSPNDRVHGLELPEELLKIFIDNSSNIAETVLDTFAGSGSIIYTAKKMKRNAIGFELDESNYLIALKNIQDNTEKGVVENANESSNEEIPTV
jgi:DNA modification methylase